ncbi:MAG: ABC transporter permease [Myxococcales bacterium]|nr:ABC transporter permease [Myxococcales bacterium]
MSALSVIFSGAMLAQTVRMVVPYACAAVGGVLSERSGVVNIALEGTLLASALAGVAVDVATGSPWAGLVAGAACGAIVGALHAALVVRGRVDAIVSGIALNLVCAGGTRFTLRALYGSSSNSPTIHGFRWGSGGLWSTLVDPCVLLALGAAALVTWGLTRTRRGLQVRAAGEDPAAARAVGIDVEATRLGAVALGGAITGLGGVALAFDLHQFQAGMSGGRGFIALAAVVVSGWRPGRAVAACVVFAALDALQIVLQGQTKVPAQLVGVLPFVATLLALVVVARHGRGAFGGPPPAGLGKHGDV